MKRGTSAHQQINESQHFTFSINANASYLLGTSTSVVFVCEWLRPLVGKLKVVPLISHESSIHLGDSVRVKFYSPLTG